MNVPEKFLHHLWKYRLFSEDKLFTHSGEKVKVVHTGQHNRDAGPDFQNARLKIGTTTWVGNVEIHIQSSDWYHHGHHKDRAYDNVVLQVVLNHNQTVRRTNREIIPTAELVFDHNLFLHYNQLLKNESWVPCENELPAVDRSIVDFWLSRLTIERLEEKTQEIEEYLENNHNNWETAFYVKMARNFGFKVNSGPFELLARSLPLRHIIRHRDNLFQLEALLFGQAGFLDQKRLDDPYHMQLFDEYTYLKRKYNLKPLGKHLWRYARLRPVNFPTVRIAQFGALMHRTDRLFSHLLEKNRLKEMWQLLKATPSQYWNTHYAFHKTSPYKVKSIGTDAFQNLIINTVVPFLFVYGKHQNKPQYREKALDLLLELPPEKNSVIDNWKNRGVEVPNAYHSQALLQLKTKYCIKHRCLDCGIGNYILAHPDGEEQYP